MNRRHAIGLLGAAGLGASCEKKSSLVPEPVGLPIDVTELRIPVLVRPVGNSFGGRNFIDAVMRLVEDANGELEWHYFVAE